MGKVRDYDMLVIGGGSGLTAAYHGAQDGKSVALVEAEPDALGGTCVNRGCIPTKGLIRSAEVMDVIRNAEQFGIRVDPACVHVDFRGIMESIRRRRDSDVAGVRSWVDKALTLFGERARFVDLRTVETESGTRIRGESVFLASGAQPAIPEIPGLDTIDFWTNETALEQSRQPETLIILGGGYVAAEFGHFFSALGTEVTLIEREDRLLQREDRAISSLFTDEFKNSADLRLGAKAEETVIDGNLMGFRVRSGDQTDTVVGEAVLVATGRRPRTKALDLARTGVKVDERGWIKVDEYLQTTQSHVYAYGDAIGKAMFKHTSSYEGKLAYQNSQGAGAKVSYHANPHAVFANPQIGSVGLTEQECESKKLEFRSVQKGFGEIARGRILNDPAGFAKLIVEKESDRILGFHMIGPQAAELIHEVVVSMNAGDGSARTLRDSIHVHPTLSELVHGVFFDVAVLEEEGG